MGNAPGTSGLKSLLGTTVSDTLLDLPKLVQRTRKLREIASSIN